MKKGVNSSLTVQRSKAGSDMRIWEEFTNEVIKFISEQNDKCVFLLLGNYAKSKSIFIKDKSKIVTEVHPSPLARGFIGSNVFKRVETILGTTVNWSTN
jgi:uracil-DNA glycosylase